MKDGKKTKKQLVYELTELRSQNTELEKSINGHISAERSVEESNRYAESIVETVREPLLILGADLKIISANRNFYKTFKVAPGETIGSLIYELGNKQWDIPELRKLLEEVLPEKQAFDDFEVVHNFQDIGSKFMLLNAREIYRKDFRAKMILLAIEDITERRRVEEKLRIYTEDTLQSSEERYRILFNAIDEGFCIIEVIFDENEKPIDYRFLVINPSFEKQTGLIGAQGKRMRELVPKHEEYWFEIYGKIAVTGQPSRFVNRAEQLHRWYDVYAFRFGEPENRQVAILFNDITEQKQLVMALQVSEEKIRNYIESAPDGVFVADETGRYLETNRSACRIIGYSKEEIEKLSIRDLLAEESLEDGLSHFNKLVETGAATSDLWYKHKDGSKLCMTVSAVKLSETRVLGFCKDITMRKKTEESLKKTLESLRKAFGTIVQVMVSAVEARDPYTAGHQLRVANIARAIATEMGLPQEKVDGIRMAGSIHDIGKLSIPSDILSKPAKLTDIEFSLIKEHARQGYEILKDVESPWPLAQIVYQHHERMDGSGYPRNLKGDEILIEARIMAVADVVESMASHRPYRPTLGINAALEEIEKNRETLYDTNVADACLRLFREKGFQLANA